MLCAVQASVSGRHMQAVSDRDLSDTDLPSADRLSEADLPEADLSAAAFVLLLRAVTDAPG
jgi:hypothetical protein